MKTLTLQDNCTYAEQLGLGLIILLISIFPFHTYAQHHDSSHVEEHASEFGLSHQFGAADDGLSLNTSLDVPVEGSILDSDEQLRVWLDIALESQNEEELMKFLNMQIGDPYKRKLLLTLGEIYEKQYSPSRIMALYERFVLEFPKDHELPRLYLKLGRMYRDAGANKTALSKFYNVLNVALNVPVNELKNYQEVSHRAQLEIAETFFIMGNYQQAAKFFNRLLRLDLVEEEYLNILFKHAYTVYLSGNYVEAIGSLKNFVTEFPDSDPAAEARYLLSESHLQLNDPKGALRETLELLTSEVGKINTNPQSWLYWKKRTGNKMANQFYQEANFLDALTIYQAMENLSLDPVWNWPVLYQVGLCYEKLDMKPKAKEAYQKIIDTSDKLTDDYKSDPTLTSIAEMAGWRIDRLDVDMDNEFNINAILSNS